MVYRPLREEAQSLADTNKGTTAKQWEAKLRFMLAQHKKGTRCLVCDQPIWVAGAAVCGSPMCFSCITGEADDYEVEEARP